ncbi:MAG: hypothetical protein AAF528_01165 [Cyanobacteria bacterium P01_C01_bin.121]
MISAPFYMWWVPERDRQEKSIERQINHLAKMSGLTEYSDAPSLYRIDGWGFNDLKLCCNAKYIGGDGIEDLGKITA